MRFQVIQNVQLREVQRRVPIDLVRVLQHNAVQPPTAALAASGHADLSAHGLHVQPDVGTFSAVRAGATTSVISQLGWERPFADTSGVCLCHTHDAVKLAWREAQAGGNAASGSRGRRDIWEGTEVEVQHRSVGTFCDDALARVVRFVDVVNTIDDHIVRKQTLAPVTDELELLINVVVKVIQALMGLDSGTELRLEFVEVLQLAHTQAQGTHGLGRVRWSNTFPCGPKPLPTTSSLHGAVDDLVVAEQQLGTVADLQAPLCVDAGIGQWRKLLEHGLNIHDAPVANEVDCVRVHKPAWQDVEGKLLAVRNHGVPSIRATIEPCHDVVVLGKHIRQFSLAF